MFGGIKSLVGDKKPVVAQPVAEEPLNLGSSNKSAFGFGTNFSKLASEVASAKALRDAATAALPQTPVKEVLPAPVTGIATLDTGATGTPIGATVAPVADTTAAPTFNYGTLNPSQQRVVDTLLDRVASGTFTAGDESRLISYGKTAGVDLIGQARDRFAAPAVETVSTFTSPTTYEQDVNQILGLRQNEERDFDTLAARVRAGETLKPDEQNRLNEYLTRGGLGTYESYFAKDFAPTSTDLFANLSYTQEQNLADLASDYAAGETLSNKQLNTLTSLLSTAGLGDIQSYFAPVTYTAPTGYESMFGAGELTPESNIGDIIGQFNTFATQNDPVAAAQYARSMGLDEAEIATLLEGFGKTKTYKRPTFTEQQLEDIFSQGEAGLQNRINTIVAANIGTDQDIQNLVNSYNTSFGTNLTVDQVKEAYSIDALKEKSIGEIEDFVQTSALNRFQEAGRFGGYLSDIFGYDNKTTLSVLKDVMSTAETAQDPALRDIYNQLTRTNQITPELQNKIYETAARLTPDSKFWTKQYDDAGNLIHDGERFFAAYSNPITTTVRQKEPGQYGFYNNAPIVSEEAALKLLNGGYFAKPTKRNGAEREQLGLNLIDSQEVGSSIKRGPEVLGIKTNILTDSAVNNYDKVMGKAAQYGNKQYTNPETGKTYYLTGYDSEGQPIYEDPNIVYSAPDSEGGRTETDISGQIAKLRSAAEKYGIDPDKYSSLSDLYGAIKDKTENLYFVTAQFNHPSSNWADEAGEKSKGKNYAGVLYQAINGKLVAVNEPTFFYYRQKDTPLQDLLGDDLGGMISEMVNLLPAEVLLMNPVTASYYPVAKAVQTAGTPGATIGDVLKDGGQAWLTTQFVPDVVAPKVFTGIGTLLGTSTELPTGMLNLAARTGTNALISAGIAGLTNQDVGDAILSSLTSSLVRGAGSGFLKAVAESDTFESFKDDFVKAVEKLSNTDSDEQFSFSNLDPKYRDLVTNIFLDTMLGQNFEDALKNGITRTVMSSIGSADKGKTTGTTKQKVVST